MKWRFGTPKNPGYGISPNFYMTVLTGRADLPKLIDVISPKGEEGAVEGFGVPGNKAAGKNSIYEPVARGDYGLASKNRRTLMRMRVLSKEEAGFDPEPFLRSALAVNVAPETAQRLRATWHLLQLTFETHDPMVLESVAFLLEVCRRLGYLTDGVIADPVGQRYLLPNQVLVQPLQRLADLAAEVVTLNLSKIGETISGQTLGMSKFGLSEFVFSDFPAGIQPLVSNLAFSLCASVLEGERITANSEIAFDRPLFEVLPHASGLALTPAAGLSWSNALEEWTRRAPQLAN